ncbi:MAG: ROK family protein [Burkholderiales bacterium]|nr:ROK family protein [Burkholderiales bacterium]
MSALRLGIDLGGTKTEAVVLDSDGQVLARRRDPSARDAYAATLEHLAACVTWADTVAAAPVRVGLGMPGSLSPFDGRVRNANSTWLNGHALQADLAQRVGREVRVANDADCFALSEAVDGAAAGARTVFGVIVGTGVGAGVVVDGRVLSGPNGSAGEWGHNPLPWTDAAEHTHAPRCWCGRVGCIETWLSGPGLAADHARATGRALDGPAIAAAAATGDAAAVATLARWADRLGRALAHVINLLDPDVIVLGGGLSALAIATDRAALGLERHVFCDAVASRVVRNAHGDASGVRGAAWLWPARRETAT